MVWKGSQCVIKISPDQPSMSGAQRLNVAREVRALHKPLVLPRGRTVVERPERAAVVEAILRDSRNRWCRCAPIHDQGN